MFPLPPLAGPNASEERPAAESGATTSGASSPYNQSQQQHGFRYPPSSSLQTSAQDSLADLASTRTTAPSHGHSHGPSAQESIAASNMAAASVGVQYPSSQEYPLGFAAGSAGAASMPNKTLNQMPHYAPDQRYYQPSGHGSYTQMPHSTNHPSTLGYFAQQHSSNHGQYLTQSRSSQYHHHPTQGRVPQYQYQPSQLPQYNYYLPPYNVPPPEEHLPQYSNYDRSHESSLSARRSVPHSSDSLASHNENIRCPDLARKQFECEAISPASSDSLASHNENIRCPDHHSRGEKNPSPIVEPLSHFKSPDEDDETGGSPAHKTN
eukprot:CAMPEP_0172577536 /NCGR_PEP_ID=MMETSP1067-20121228/138281_1 /TAXON_ID=265564 ORGANISM="Thalassiosira punctigera, Strain Tpunct2005C2" /NCGR_SAMPLE_ID=MMETSP1067 /ASSEMBLY_ACC=CAM_ASM_000444 /LENGTH=321 /DNA_ID=CAMNT_0013370225 /DNA_START=663 /DNA_END=1629 /DNA_ORIENTATION=+